MADSLHKESAFLQENLWLINSHKKGCTIYNFKFFIHTYLLPKG